MSFPTIFDVPSTLTAAWCANGWGWFCSDADVKAGRGYLQPQDYYKPPSLPPAVRPPADLTIPPASSIEAAATVDAILARQMSEWQQQSAADFAALPTPAGGGDNWTLYAVAAGAAALLILILTRR